jgi:hypothetical protein
MKRLLLLLMLIGIAGAPAAASSYFLSPDVPTDDPAGSGTVFMPWDIVWHQAGAYTLALSLPPDTAVDALHQMCSGDWLISVEVPTELPPGSGTLYFPGDVVRTNGVAYALYFDASAAGVPAGTNVDAAFLNGGDSAPLVLSFDVPTTLGGTTYDPADLVRWAGGSFGIFLDGSGTTPPVPQSDDVSAADHRVTPVVAQSILSFDVPSAVGTPDFLPGESVSWDSVLFSSFFLDPSWAISSRLDALSLPADPGRVPQFAPPSLKVVKSATFPPDLDLSWWPSTSVGANDYAIYEGVLFSWYSHGSLLCSTGGATTATITPSSGNRYYLVVPMNDYDEGSYGTDSSGAERPQGTSPCRVYQALGCP